MNIEHDWNDVGDRWAEIYNVTIWREQVMRAGDLMARAALADALFGWLP